MKKFSSKRLRGFSQTRSPKRNTLPSLLRMESLESRLLLNSAPTFASIADDLVVYTDVPLYIALDGYDADGDDLTYEVEISGTGLTGEVLENNRSVVMDIDGYGEMTFELFEQRAPETTSNFIDLVNSGFYDGLTFHRVAEYGDGTPFVIQGGDPNGDGTGGPGYSFDDEFDPELVHSSSGILSMANSGDDTNGSQFFITATATSHLDFNHSVFGFLTEGEDVREAIQSAEVDENSAPVDDIVIDSVEVFYDTENGTLMLTAADGAVGEADVTIRCYDTAGNMTEQTVTVTISPNNTDHYPYLKDVDPIELGPGESVTINLEAFDLEGDYVTFDGTVYPESDDITLVVNEDGSATITAAEGAGGVYGVYVGVRQLSTSNWDTQMVPVYVAPEAPGSVVLSETSDTGTIGDDLTAENNQLRFEVSDVIDGAEVSLFVDGSLVASGVADGTSVELITDLDIDFADGTHEITATQTLLDQAVEIGNIDDTVDLISEASTPLSFTVDTVAPVINSEAPLNATAGIPYAYALDVSSSDSGTLTYTLSTSPSGMTIDPATGQISWTPDSSHAATEDVSVIVTDGAGNSDTQSWTIAVERGPIVEAIDNQSIDEGQNLTLSVVAESGIVDPSVTFGLAEGNPEGVEIDPNTGVLNWTPSEAQGPAVHTITVAATNASGAITFVSFEVNVGEVNLAPVITQIDDISIDEGALLQLVAEAFDPDLPAGALTFALEAGAPDGLSIDPTTGQLTWRPSEDDGGGSFDVTINVSDPDGESDSASFTIDVNEVDLPPVFANVGNKILFPGQSTTIDISASDPDVPTNSLRYQFAEPDSVPEGMMIDPVTGQIAWDVPPSIIFENISVSVEAVEVLDGGGDGLSSIKKISMTVFNPWALTMNIVSGGRGNKLSKAELDPELLLTLSIRAEVNRGDAQPNDRPDNRQIGLEGVLGFELGGDGSFTFGRTSQTATKTEKKTEDKKTNKLENKPIHHEVRRPIDGRIEQKQSSHETPKAPEQPTGQEQSSKERAATQTEIALQEATDDAIEKLFGSNSADENLATAEQAINESR